MRSTGVKAQSGRWHRPITDHGSRITTLAALTGPSAALAQNGAAVPGPSVLPTILALVLVLALIPVAVWLLKKFGAAHPAAAQAAGLKVITQLALGPRERVVVIEAGDRWLLLGVTAAAVNRIGTLPRPDDAHAAVGSAVPSGNAFRQLLQQIRAGK
jgi:flagellar protein FliO/FliZ